MDRSPPFDEGYHGDTNEPAMPIDRNADVKVAALLLPLESRLSLIQSLCQSLPNALRLNLLDDIGAMVFHDPVPKLPMELMLQIFSHLPPKDLLTSSAVSRPWRERTHDERLWRDCFHGEGWLVDRSKMLGAEDLAKRKGAQVAERIMRTRTHGKKPAAQRRDSRKRPRDEAFSENESTLAHAGGPLEEEHDGAESMEGVESTDVLALGRMREADCNDYDSDLDSTPDAPALASMTSLKIHPSVFSTAKEPKLSWSYLYKQRRKLESNWDNGRYTMFRLPHPNYEEEGHSECVYTIQHHGNYLVSGSRDKTIRVWDLNTCRLKMNPLVGHSASVLCLQIDTRSGDHRDVIISGGSDNQVIIWRFSTGERLYQFAAHNESVLNLRFDDRYLITCSKDKTIRIWNRHSIKANDPLIPARVIPDFINKFGADTMLPPYTLLDTLVGHQAAVNAVQITGDIIVSASGDRTIKSWDLQAGSHKKSYTGHTKGIACVQFDGRRIVSGSSDNSVRIFDYETTAEVACLDGHTNLVRTVQARFGDLDITTDEELLEQSREADKNFLRQLDRGMEPVQGPARRRNAGSRRPEDMLSYGTKIPPGGGGSKWAKIVSGSYDETIIIWKCGKDGKWRPNHRLQQGQQTGRPAARQGVAQGAPLLPQQVAAIQQAQVVIQQATNTILQSNAAPQHQAQGNQIPNGVTANLNTQAQALHNLLQQQQSNNAAPGTAGAQPAPPGPNHPAAAHALPQPVAAPAAAGQAAAHAHHHHHHHHARPETNRVFKLQFDARRIISCSQNRVVVGWDFANGDRDLEWIGDWSVETP